MVRLVSSALLCVAIFTFWNARALAITEFCPAELIVAPVPAAGASSQTYGIELQAMSARAVDATIAFDTDQGWFQVKSGKVTLTRTQRTKYIGGPTVRAWNLPVYASSPMYVRFPQPVVIHNALITNALSTGDAFGWADRGQVTCPPVAGSGLMLMSPTYRYFPPELRVLSSPPTAQSPVLDALRRTALEPATCKKTFEDAIVTHQVEPEYPDFASTVGDSTAGVSIEVALNPDGTVDDAWVIGSSGDASVDQAALKAATQSTYKGATEYCHAAPGLYEFDVQYDMFNAR